MSADLLRNPVPKLGRPVEDAEQVEPAYDTPVGLDQHEIGVTARGLVGQPLIELVAEVLEVVVAAVGDRRSTVGTYCPAQPARRGSETSESTPQYHLGMHPDESLHGSVMVTKGGSILADMTGGAADVENGLPCTTQTRFQIASVSKQFTAASLMLLVESGHLDLKEPVGRWLPGAPPTWEQVTMHQILSHTAGIPHWREAPGLDPAEHMTSRDRLDSILAAPLRSVPGAQWHYSSPGYVLAGSIVEQVSGQPYREFVTERILSALRLAGTTVGAIPPSAARGYKAANAVTPFDLNAMPGTGDIWSTASDLTRFIVALHHGEVVSTSSLRAMCTAQVGVDDDDDEGDPRLTTTGYGYGMYTGVFGGHSALYHPGDNPGYRSLSCWMPEQAASIVILLNDEAGDMTGLLRELIALTLES